jgi:shikimate kinase
VNIVLVGYRGAGKSTVGRLLAKRLGMRYVCMDAEIIKSMNMDTSEIVQKYGWDTFREIESELAKELTWLDGIIIDTGGGVIERRENIDYLRQNTVVFWLQASVETILSRIKDCTARPALTAGKTFLEEVSDVLAVREPKYRSAAHHQINTDGSDPNQEVEAIARIWESLPPGKRTPAGSQEVGELTFLKKVVLG